jgi:hypothetical protein
LPGLTVPISLFRTDVAITDETGKRFYHHVMYSFPGAGRVSSSTLRVKVGAASLVGATPGDMLLRASIRSPISRQPARFASGAPPTM